jgi:uncharacterized repeat protein (TIGR02543 family)
LAEFTDVASVPNAEFYVEPGNWDFTVEGYKESVVVLSGSLTSQVIPAAGASLTLSVSPVSGADGSVKISIQLPSGSGITSAQIIKEGDDVGTYHPDASGLVVFEADYPAGVYYIVVKLYNDDEELFGVFSETYYVWAHLLSENTYTPAREDLNSIYTVELHDWHEVNGDVSSTHEAYYRRTDAALTLPAPPITGMWTAPSGEDYLFKGWYADENLTGSPVTTIPAGSVGDKAFYAYWELVIPIPPDATLEAALTCIQQNAEPGDYTITLTRDEDIAGISPNLLIYSGIPVSITLVSDTPRIITLTSTGSLLTVGDGATLILGANISLTGNSGNNAALVTVNSGGTLVMETGSKISDNNGGSNGGGIKVASGGEFTMSGGEISGNTADLGGGVFGTFKMSGGTISGNTATSGDGGGVYVTGGSTFEMSDGEISGNTATSGSGGGVAVSSGCAFEMSGGTISGNTATNGGGVYAYGTFEMSGGTISHNTANTGKGGGVYVDNSTFTKTLNGTIYGLNATDALKNTAGSGEGHAVYVYNGSKKRNDTAGTGVTLDSTQAGMAGGWEGTLAQALDWLATNAVDNGNYTITVYADESMPGKTLNYDSKSVSITLISATTRTISLSNTGSLLTVGTGVTLTLGANISLAGMSSNNAALVTVNSGGTLVMETGSKISGNTNSSNGGGVYVNGGGTFTMSGGTISGNTSNNGGGVYMYSSSTFTMSDGEISGNTANVSGGGVYVVGGTFTKSSNGTIYGSNASNALKNTASRNTNGYAVYIAGGTQLRDTTAGTGVTLDNTKSGSAGGWEDVFPED